MLNKELQDRIIDAIFSHTNELLELSGQDAYLHWHGSSFIFKEFITDRLNREFRPKYYDNYQTMVEDGVFYMQYVETGTKVHNMIELSLIDVKKQIRERRLDKILS